MNDQSILDYSSSFLFCPGRQNNLRLQIESRTTIRTGSKHFQIYQCAPCKAENTFADQQLFQEDNYDFIPIFCEDQVVVFRTFVRVHKHYRTLYKVDELWAAPLLLNSQKTDKAEPLETYEQVQRCAKTHALIVGRTCLTSKDGSWEASLEYPVKTLNIHPQKPVFQIDTGPISLPELDSRPAKILERLNLAFIAWNKPNQADFILQAPTLVEESVFTYHYSRQQSHPVRNELFAL